MRSGAGIVDEDSEELLMTIRVGDLVKEAEEGRIGEKSLLRPGWRFQKSIIVR